MIQELISFGFDPSEIEAPCFSDRPLSHLPDWTEFPYYRPINDPFFVDWISENLKVSPGESDANPEMMTSNIDAGFAGMNPLLEAILIESHDEVKRLVSQVPLNDQNNLLGQYELHLAVFGPQHHI